MGEPHRGASPPRGRIGSRWSSESWWFSPRWPRSYSSSESRRMLISCAGDTHVGVVRSGNEDNFLLDFEHGVFVVADGMGGHAAGEVASEMAVQIISKELGVLRGLSDAAAAERLRSAIRTANQAIFERTL